MPGILFMKGVPNSLGVEEFIRTGFDLKSHLANFLGVTIKDVEKLLPTSSDDLAALHPGSLKAEDANEFYEKNVGTGHLLELSAWHLSSSNYIADTIKLESMFSRGQVLDFGGGIGTHALAAAGLENVDHVWFVDLNPNNREFVMKRAHLLGIEKKISVHRGIENTGEVLFDTLICLDVLEHLPDPSSQLKHFLKRLSPKANVLLNWYFFKGFRGEYPFHFDDPLMIKNFFQTLQGSFIEVFHPYLITTRLYQPI